MNQLAILGTGTAVPSNAYDQARISAVVEALFQDTVDDLSRLLAVFQHSHIKQRHLIKDPEWYAEDHGFAATNQAYADAAVQLSEQAIRQALDVSGITAQECAGIVVASTTGLMTPSLDAALIKRLNMSPTSMRLPIFGLGCAGGVAGLARAAELCAVRNGKPLIFVAVEICSATFQKNDISKSNLIGSSIFADGAAAVVIGAPTDDSKITVKAPYSFLFSETEDIMGWDFLDSGFKVRFSRDIPTFVQKHVPEVLEGACNEWGIKAADVTSYITHPGGAKVLEAFATATISPKEKFDWAYQVLENYGNMSSASVMFVLHAMIKNNALEPGLALMSALGPGFSSEQLLLEVTK